MTVSEEPTAKFSVQGHQTIRCHTPQDRNFATRDSKKHEYQECKFSIYFFASFPYFPFALPFSLLRALTKVKKTKKNLCEDNVRPSVSD
jgi:hypothetical protein